MVGVTGHAAPGNNWVADARAGRALSGSTEELATAFRSYAEAGIEHILSLAGPKHDLRPGCTLPGSRIARQHGVRH